MDGRRQRSEASREKIIRAMIELLSDGDVTPSAEAVAERAGVGLRTVFRQFENMDSLYQQINALVSAEIRPMWGRPFVSSDWRSKVFEVIERRIGIFERIMPLKIAADVHRHRSTFLAAQTGDLVREQRAALGAVLADAKSADPLLLESLDLLLSFDTWRRLRKDQKLTRPRARAVLEHMAASLIGPPPCKSDQGKSDPRRSDPGETPA
jgi:AcrR family transcriptional regulator